MATLAQVTVKVPVLVSILLMRMCIYVSRSVSPTTHMLILAVETNVLQSATTPIYILLLTTRPRHASIFVLAPNILQIASFTCVFSTALLVIMPTVPQPTIRVLIGVLAHILVIIALEQESVSERVQHSLNYLAIQIMHQEGSAWLFAE